MVTASFFPINTLANTFAFEGNCHWNIVISSKTTNYFAKIQKQLSYLFAKKRTIRITNL